MNTPDRAQYAKFAQEFSGFQEAVTNAFLNEKMKLSTSGQYRTDEQIYYKIATGTDTQGTPTPTKTSSNLGLTLLPDGLYGQKYYRMTSTEVEGIKIHEKFSEAGGDLYVSEKGEVFVLPGYLVEENGTKKWYVNASQYYLGEGAELGGGDIPEVNEEDLAKLYAYFVTHSDEMIETESGFGNNNYLDDANTIVVSGYSLGAVSIEPYTQLMFVYYNESHYKVVLEEDGLTGNFIPSNVEAMVYSSSLPDSDRMYQYFVVLQMPCNFGNVITCANVPPITDAEVNLQRMDEWDAMNNKKCSVYLYHDNYYGITFDKTTYRFESVTPFTDPIDMFEFGYIPASAEAVYNNYESENSMNVTIVLYEDNYYKLTFNSTTGEKTVTLMEMKEVFEYGIIPDSAELVGEWTGYAVYSYAGKRYLVDNGYVKELPGYDFRSNGERTVFNLIEVVFDSTYGYTTNDIEILPSYNPTLTVTLDNTEQVFDLKPCITNGKIDILLLPNEAEISGLDGTIHLTYNGHEATWTGQIDPPAEMH